MVQLHGSWVAMPTPFTEDTFMSGGKGTLWGTAIGVFIVGVLRNSLNLLGVNTFWQGTAIGVVIILAVLAEQLSHKKKDN